MPTCRSCEAEVVFVKSEKSGTPMILDAIPAKGVILVTESLSGVGSIPTKYLDEDARADVVDVYTDHHATCPDAKAWDGRTRASGPIGHLEAAADPLSSWPLRDV